MNEQKLRKIVNGSIRKAINEYYLDAEPYEEDSFDEIQKFNDISKKYAKMPKGYDKDLTDEPTIDRLTLLNKNYETDAYPYAKQRQNNASWAALNALRKSGF